MKRLGGLNDEQVCNEVLTVYATGHETTTTVLTGAWYALNQHAEELHALQHARFASDRRAQLHKSGYQPFLIGLHLCIGNHFALMDGQLLALMVQR